MSRITRQEENFRDKVATIDTEGRRIWIYPKKPSGKLTRARTVTSCFLILFLFAAPFVRMNGEQLILLNILERHFVFFGITFWPQDFHLFVLATISLVIFIVLFTAVFGRVWCGWACPQTVFMEMLFRKIEYLIEGDARKQIALNKAPWTANKIFKKTIKHLIFYGISFVIGNVFLSYIIGSKTLLSIISDPPSEHVIGLTAMILFSIVFYWVFAYFREQACTMVCPYGRLQGVLLDQNSIVVAYDFKRGEPRGRLSRNKKRGDQGDCVDCRQCVDVCPTGIDIRHGTQLECINCTACIDACNTVMQKVSHPTGLIRYASYNGIDTGARLRFTPRLAGYSTVLSLLIIITAVLFVLRTPIETIILRTPGVLYQESAGGGISNLYNLKVINKTATAKKIRLVLRSPEGTIRMVGGNMEISDNDLSQSAFFVEIPREQLRLVNTPLSIGVYANDELIEEIHTSFIGPEVKF